MNPSPWDFEIISAPPCPEDNVIRFVKSSPFNFELRNLVRSHIRNQRSNFNRTLFLIGSVPVEDSRKSYLAKEIDRFNDFIIGDYIDAYKNVTRKSYSAYRWALYRRIHDAYAAYDMPWYQHGSVPSDIGQLCTGNVFRGFPWLISADIAYII